MNYTEKYHLPQWEETDRIMRTDFNQMCTDIESGISSGRADCAEKTAELRESTLDSLFRTARNHYFLVTSETPMPSQIGVFRQAFDGSTPLSGGMIQKDGYAWMTWEGEGFTSEEFRTSLKVESHLDALATNVARATPLVISFTARGAGRFEELSFLISYTASGSGDCSFSLSVQDLTAGEAISGASFRAASRGGNSTLSHCTIYPNIDLKVGHRYRITFAATSAPVNTYTTTSTTFSPRVTSYHAPSVTLAHQFSEAEDSMGGLALVRYAVEGTKSTVDLYWDGERIEPAQVRTLTDGKGRQTREVEYRRRDAVPAESRVELRMNCAEREEISLYEWGGTLI